MASDSLVRVLFTGDSASAVRAVGRLEGSFGGLSKAAHLATAAVGIGLAAGIGAAVKAAVDFDRAMRNVNSIAQLSEGQFKSLEKQVLSLSKETGQAPKTLADGLYDIVSSGFKANEGIKVLRASAKAATAGLTDTATATKAVVAILNAYHLSANKAREVSDVLFQEVNLGVNTFEELAQNIGDTAPQAAALKIPFSEVAAALATITRHGTDMAEASTQVSRVLTALIKPTDSLTKEFHKLGFENGQAAVESLGFSGVIKRLSDDAHGNQQVLADWLGDIRGIRGVINLTGANLKEYNAVLNQMGDATKGNGATQRAFAEQAKSLSFQWEHAKAALIAAAIPLGQLLFPLLAKSAEAVQQFAGAIQQHLPEIRQEFQNLSGAVTGVTFALETMFANNTGISAFGGIIATVLGAKSFLAVKNFGAALFAAGGILQSLGPIGIAAAAGLGLLTFAFLKTGTEVHVLKGEIDALNHAIDASQQAADKHAHTQLEVQAADLGVIQAKRAAKVALDQYNAALRSGDPARAKDAQLAYKQALLTVKQALQNQKDAHKADAKAADEAGTAHANQTQKIRALKKAADEQVGASNRLIQGQKNVAAAGGITDKILDEQQHLLRSTTVADYAKTLGRLTAAMGGTKQQVRDTVKAVEALYQALGRLPTRKQVQIIVTEERRTRQQERRYGQSRPSASGGLIPMSAGMPGVDSVPILAQPGEMILNQSQQDALGGTSFLAGLFGFGPGHWEGEVQTFAAGGPVKKPKGKGSKPSPHHRRRGRKRSVRRARHALQAVEDVNQAEENLDRAYGQLVRQYDVTQEVYIRTDDAGNDYISQPDIDRRVGEIDSLIVERGKMLELLDDEKEKLKAAIAALKAAIARLVEAIKNERAAIRELHHKISDERKKKKDKHGRGGPNENLIGRWQNEINRHESTIGDYQGQISDFNSSIDEERDNLRNRLGFDRRDVELDIDTLQAERVDVVGTKLPPQAGGSGGGGNPVDQELLRQLGILRLALGIQTAQAGIIGSFQRGTINVPETGLALVHAGEGITPAGRPRGGDSAPPGDVHVDVVFEDKAMDWLKQFVRVEFSNNADEVGLRIGRKADERLRSGRF